MHAIMFDTLHYANKLKQAGVPPKQAEAQAEAMAEIIETQLVTKQDLQHTCDKIESKIDLRVSELKSELIKWMLGALIAQGTIIISCLKFIH